MISMPDDENFVYPTLTLLKELLPNRQPTLVRKFLYPTHLSSVPTPL